MRLPLRGVDHHVLTWGEADAPMLFLVHGWMDVAASFQFLIDALARRWHVIAPDLRGFGDSAWQPQGYWYPDYLADLEALLDHFAPAQPVRLVGHSLGGNIVMHYAGARPTRVSAVVSLEGFGIPAERPEAAPDKLAAWLDAVKSPPRFQPYADLAAVASRLRRNNPRLSADKAAFLASAWARTLPDGQAQLRSDPRHKLPFPTVYRMEEIEAIWSRITCPVLWVAAADSHIPRWLNAHPEGEGAVDSLAAVRQRLTRVPHGELVVVQDSGHMLHHDQPQAVAKAIDGFFPEV